MQDHDGALYLLFFFKNPKATLFQMVFFFVANWPGEISVELGETLSKPTSPLIELFKVFLSFANISTGSSLNGSRLHVHTPEVNQIGKFEKTVNCKVLSRGVPCQPFSL
jgi:hypothetical protein